MNRDVCGICWGAYDEGGQCECAPAPVARDDAALCEALEFYRDQVNHWRNNADCLQQQVDDDKELLLQCLEALTASRRFLLIDLNVAIEQGRHDAIEKEAALRKHDEAIDALKERLK